MAMLIVKKQEKKITKTKEKNQKKYPNKTNVSVFVRTPCTQI